MALLGPEENDRERPRAAGPEAEWAPKPPPDGGVTKEVGVVGEDAAPRDVSDAPMAISYKDAPAVRLFPPQAAAMAGRVAGDAAAERDGVKAGAASSGRVRSEVEIVEEFRQRLAPLLYPVCKLLDEAAVHGLEIRFALQKGPSGRFMIPPIDIVKHL